MTHSQSTTLGDKAQPLANYPHGKRVGDYIFVSGISSRRPDGSVAGATPNAAGGHDLDVRLQTEAVIANIRDILASFGAELSDLCDTTCYLVDMADYAGFNEVYNRYFDAQSGPCRTTVAVRELPNPRLNIEVKATAYKPQR